MKVAQTAQGHLIRAEEAVKSQLKTGFFCPKCQKAVHLHCGGQKAPYFAHIAHYVPGGGEGLAHQVGKQAIAELASMLNWQVTFEAAIGFEQRADVFLTQHQQQLIVEYQCSPLTPSKLNQRTLGYRRQHLPVQWVVGDRYRFVKHHLSQQQLGFISYRRQWGFYVVCYSVKQHQWLLYHHIVARDFVGYAWQTAYLTTVEFGQLILKQSALPSVGASGDSIQVQQRQVIRNLGLQEPHCLALQAACYARRQRLQNVPMWCYCTQNVPPIYQLNQFESRVSWWLAKQPIMAFLTYAPLLQQPLFEQSSFEQWGQVALVRTIKKEP
ncbi:competence protein CoiA [Latilactobacillus graminis]|uniref:Competence CoiA-like family protein n=2 Tax=Latilactobacillus graminis TaxID=60519 RepID=A0AA89I027_9LACO|nr:competence protein CoiA family protein [Latilactobacillus graminis]KRM21077.1 competence CoiA-like family protein [Latilactobacillus graminis DSM 20719]QFP79206.1 hypothetical protein LG542_02740 [Latilactobacillus graminis]